MIINTYFIDPTSAVKPITTIFPTKPRDDARYVEYYWLV